MSEIRVAWVSRIQRRAGVFEDGGLWLPDTPEVRRALGTVVDAANSEYGPRTHWIEERRAEEGEGDSPHSATFSS